MVLKKKPTFHIGDGAYEGPVRLGSTVLCGVTAGTTMGVLTSHNFMQPTIQTKLEPEGYYTVHLTRKGLRTISEDYRAAAASSIKMYGYYSTYFDGCQFNVCKKCLNSEEFGLLALATL